MSTYPNILGVLDVGPLESGKTELRPTPILAHATVAYVAQIASVPFP